MVFPVPIMLLVPVRQYIMPKMFPLAALALLDPLPGEEESESTTPSRSNGTQVTRPVDPAEDLAWNIWRVHLFAQLRK